MRLHRRSPWTVQSYHAYARSLEANGKVSGIGEISHPYPSQTGPLDQFRCRFKYITMSAQGVDVQNLIKIDSAIAALRMREKQIGFAWDPHGAVVTAN